MPFSTTWRSFAGRSSGLAAVGAAALGCVLLSGAAGSALDGRSLADTRLAGLKAGYRAPVPVASDVAERDPVWRLGRTLFHDPGLSASGRTACATCHQVGHGWANADPRAIGDGGKRLAFKAPTLLDVGTIDRFGWTGRFADVAAVTTFAITSPNNMGMPLAGVAERLRRERAYADAFRSAFGDDAIDDAGILRALGAYVTSLRTSTPFDRWIAGDETAIGDDAKRGFAVFTGKGHCAECHSGASFTDGSFHDIGSSTDDPGRGKLFKTSVKLRFAFKTPSLRDVADRAPYMHDGSRATLDEVVDLYDRGGIDRPSRADVIRPLHLGGTEKADLIAFLRTLSGETRYVLAR